MRFPADDSAGQAAQPAVSGRGDATLSVFRPVSSRATGMAAKKTRASTRSPLERLRRACLALPGAWEKLSHGEPTFWAGKRMFASFANADNHHGAGRYAVWCKATHATQDMLIARSPEVISVHRMPAPADGSASTSTPQRTGRKSPNGSATRTNWPHLLACAAQRVAPRPRHVEGRDMASERQKMLAGEMYDPLDPELVAARERARDLCQSLNATREAETEERRRILRELFATGGDTVWMQPPFFCDYGSNIELGSQSLLQLQLCRARRLPRPHRRLHALRPGGADLHAPPPAECRRAAALGVRQADRHRIGRVGRRRRDHPARRDASVRAPSSAPAASSRADIPDGVFAAGNPCRVIREITE